MTRYDIVVSVFGAVGVVDEVADVTNSNIARNTVASDPSNHHPLMAGDEFNIVEGPALLQVRIL